jgi:lysozyme family protein
MTKYGISQKSYPDLDIENLTKEEAIAIYERDFWRPYQGFEDRLATKLFDLAVNMGHKKAVQILQRALQCLGANIADDGILGPKTRQAVALANVDLLLTSIKSEAAGVYRNIAAVNPITIRISSRSLGAQAQGCTRRTAQAEHRNDALINLLCLGLNARQKKFLKGWLRRAYDK